MVAQSPPYAEQNAQHDARLFRLASFSPWRDASGIVGPTDFAVTAQSTPNMSVQVAAGRAWLKGTQIGNVSGGGWSTQGAYYAYNDAPVTLTVAAADPTNPRIDAVVAYVTDAFYSGSTNTFTLGIVTGTPAGSPATPAVPSNGLLLGTIAVAANATSISTGNIAQTALATLLLTARGGIPPVLSTDATPGLYTGQERDHPTNGLERWDGAKWTTPLPLGQWITPVASATSYSYTLPSGAADLPGYAVANVGAPFIPAGRQIEVQFRAPQVQIPYAGGSANLVILVNGVVVDGAFISSIAPPGGGFGFSATPVLLSGVYKPASAGTYGINVQGWGGGNAFVTAGASMGPYIRYRII